MNILYAVVKHLNIRYGVGGLRALLHPMMDTLGAPLGPIGPLRHNVLCDFLRMRGLLL
jgi:hypothetical protein